jgi:hypothetical protein
LTWRNNTLAIMEQIMNSQINWNNILIHKEQKLDKKEQNFSERGTKFWIQFRLIEITS